MSLPIVEIFGFNNSNNSRGTLQGEGLRMGVPSIFIRTGGCNLTCKGFGCTLKSPLDGSELQGCDSIQAVNAKHFKQSWKYFNTSKELIEEVLKHYPNNNNLSEKPDIVITGGEPTLHHTDPVMIGLLEYFISRGHKIFFETNGTQYIDFQKHDIYKKVSFTISIKMSTSGEEKNKRWKPEVVNEYLKNTKDSYFKFVMSKENIEEDSKEVFDFLSQVPTFGIVYCMPLGSTSKELDENAKTVYEFAAKNGFRYSDRLHIRMYDDLAGV